MTPEQMAEKAPELFLDGFHCSQAIVAVAAEMLNIDAPDVIAAMAPFGGGIASTGNVCGTLSGAIAAIGLPMGKKTPRERDHREMWKLSHRMVKEFEKITEEYGGIKCSDIARVDWKDREQVKAFYKAPDSARHTECTKVIRETALALGRMLKEAETGK